jgi:predicted O-methyltransferase YrrM
MGPTGRIGSPRREEALLPTDDPRWHQVDDYLHDRLVPHDPALEQAIADSDAAGLPAINVSSLQGRFLWLLAMAAGARRVLEIVTLGGYSTIWLARAVGPEGRVVSLELLDEHAAVARRNLERAGVDDRVEIIVGPALDRLARLQGREPFDMAFIDADKANNPHYLRAAIDLGRPGTLIVVDNVVRDGRVANPVEDDPAVAGTRAMFDLAFELDDFDATVLQTVGIKGYDGFLIGVVR